MKENDVTAAAKRAMLVAEGDLDETGLKLPEIEERLPYHVLRLLHGAQVTTGVRPGLQQLHCEGNCYIMTDEALAMYQRVRDKIQTEVLDQNGIVPPYGPEALVRILAAAQHCAHTECRLPADKLRVLFLRNQEGGCAFYRVIQPTAELNTRDDAPIWAEENGFLTYRLGCNYDVIIAPRIADTFTISVLRALQKAKKIVVYETDDLLNNMPAWNPNSQRITPDDQMRRDFILKSSDALIVSTEELGALIGRKDTWICHNGINPELWPLKAADQNTPVVRVLWAGSGTHEGDLRLVTKSIRKLISRFKGRVQFVFAGALPEEFKGVVKRDGRLYECVRTELEGAVVFAGSTSPNDWPKLLASTNCNIAIAPLERHPFNEAKSEVKILEAWALGLPVIASRIAPYERAIQDESQGFLVGPEPENWEVALERLIQRPDERIAMAEAGLKRLIQHYLMSSIGNQYEIALYEIAKGRVRRPECNAAMEARLQALKEIQ